MMYNKKSLLVKAAAGLIGLMMVTGCPDETTTTAGTGTGTEPKAVPSEVGPEIVVDKTEPEVVAKAGLTQVNIPNVGGINLLAASNDGIYASNGKNLMFVAKADANDGTKYQDIKLGNTGLNGEAGQAALTGATFVTGMKGTEKGALVELVTDSKASNNQNNGVAYFEGTQAISAWSSAGSGLTVTTGKDVIFSSKLIGTGDKVGVQLLASGVLTRDDKEFPLLFKKNYRYAVSGVNALGEAGKLSSWVAYKSGWTADSAFPNNPYVAMADDVALLVTNSGVRYLTADQIGSAKEVGTKEFKNGYSDKWKHNKGTWGSALRGRSIWGFDNNKVSAAVYHKGVLYIGLNVRDVSQAKEEATGGVVSYGVVKAENGKVSLTGPVLYQTAGHSIVNFVILGDKVYAVATDGVFVVAQVTATENDTETIMGEANIVTVEGLATDAVITAAVAGADDNLVLATDKGVFAGKIQ